MAQLEHYVKMAKKKGGFNELKKLYNDIKSGKIKIKDPNPPRDFIEYLVRLEYSGCPCMIFRLFLIFW